MLHEIQCWVVKKPTRKQCHMDENTNTVPKYKTPLRKIQRLRKLIVILNLLIIGIAFTILSFKRELINVFLVYLLEIGEKKCTLIRDIL
jgi:hypothetical protein